MKKTLLFIVAISCVSALRAQSDNFHCNASTPGWGNNLGKVTFRTSDTWKVGDQEWSDVVTATNCQKETFNGGPDALGFFNADCKKNTTGYGDLFSWCAVIRFERQLCPRGWRLPTVSDFVQLDQTIGGMGERRRYDQRTLGQYGVAGFPFGGRCSPDGVLDNQGFGAYYWAVSENRADRGHRLNFFMDGYVTPQGWEIKSYGHTVRCIKDVK